MVRQRSHSAPSSMNRLPQSKQMQGVGKGIFVQEVVLLHSSLPLVTPAKEAPSSSAIGYRCNVTAAGL